MVLITSTGVVGTVEYVRETAATIDADTLTLFELCSCEHLLHASEHVRVTLLIVAKCRFQSVATCRKEKMA